MGSVRTPVPVLLVVACFSRYGEARRWSQDRLEDEYGPTGLVSAPYAFVQTGYYEKTMGSELYKQFFTFEQLVSPEALPDIKLQTNALENELRDTGLFVEERPLNLDPGILSLGKFQLATTKDQAHRVYLRDGILTEVTLRYQDKAFHPWPWTYADYRQECVNAFLLEARAYYRKRLAEFPT